MSLLTRCCRSSRQQCNRPTCEFKPESQFNKAIWIRLVGDIKAWQIRFGFIVRTQFPGPSMFHAEAGWQRPIEPSGDRSRNVDNWNLGAE